MRSCRGPHDVDQNSKRRRVPVGNADVVRPATRLARSGTLSVDMRSRCGSGCSRDDGRLCELLTLGTAAPHSSRSRREQRQALWTERRSGTRLVRGLQAAARNRLIACQRSACRASGSPRTYLLTARPVRRLRHDADSVIHVLHARRRPRGALGLITLRPGSDVAGQDHLAVLGND
jgi:hypothetical protein